MLIKARGFRQQAVCCQDFKQHDDVTTCLQNYMWHTKYPHLFDPLSNWPHRCSSRYTAAHRRISQTPASQRLRPVAVSARLAPSHASYRGPELVWATGRLMSPDRGFGSSCLLHCGHLTVSANSEDSWKRFCLSRTRLRRLVTLASRRRI